MNIPPVKRRSFLGGLGASAVAAAAGTGTARADATSSDGDVCLYAGGWNNHGGQEGLWLYRFDQKTGRLTLVKQISDEISSNFLYIDRSRNVFYCPDESDLPLDAAAGALLGYSTGGGGRIFAYRVDTSTGDLTEIGRGRSYGSDPTMVWPDPTGRYLCCAIHTNGNAVCRTERAADGTYRIVPQGPSGNLVLFPVGKDGTLSEPVDIVTWPRGSLPQCLTWEPRGRFFLAADRGTGKLYSYRIDYARKAFVQTADPVDLGSTTGPRYVRFHPDRPWVYVNHERSMALKAFSYDDHGKLTEINEALAVPDSWMSQVPENGRAEQQDLKLSADGRFLYSVYRAGEDILASNGERSYVPGFEGVAVFSVDQRNGKVTAVQRLELDCEWARGCAISPNGKWLVVGALFSDELITLAIGADGRLTDTGIRTPQPSAAGVTFFKPGSASDDGVSGGFF